VPLTVEQSETGRLIRVEGDFTVTSASELKSLLLEGLEKHLEVDLTCAQEIDVSLLQLLFAAAREPVHQARGIVSGVSEAAASAARDAGFVEFPGTNNSGVTVA